MEAFPESERGTVLAKPGEGQGRDDPTLPTGIAIAGPTASGKSALAMAIAEAFGGTVINADSQQLHADLRILTARPSPADEERVPHRLYGDLGPFEPGTAGDWSRRAAAVVAEVLAEGGVPVVCGGTGLYLNALLRGLSPIPEVPESVREEARSLFLREGQRRFHARLAAVDPVMAQRLPPSDSQRVLRAYEIVMATGRSLAQWQTAPPVAPVAARWLTVLLMPPREPLYAACDQRFRAMVANGALDEVRDLIAHDIPDEAPVWRALGARDLALHLEGAQSLEDAIVLGQTATRHYVKRQITWFRHQIDADVTVPAQYSESLPDEIFPKIREFLLTGPASRT